MKSLFVMGVAVLTLGQGQVLNRQQDWSPAEFNISKDGNPIARITGATGVSDNEMNFDI